MISHRQKWIYITIVLYFILSNGDFTVLGENPLNSSFISQLNTNISDSVDYENLFQSELLLNNIINKTKYLLNSGQEMLSTMESVYQCDPKVVKFVNSIDPPINIEVNPNENQQVEDLSERISSSLHEFVDKLINGWDNFWNGIWGAQNISNTLVPPGVNITLHTNSSNRTIICGSAVVPWTSSMQCYRVFKDILAEISFGDRCNITQPLYQLADVLNSTNKLTHIGFDNLHSKVEGVFEKYRENILRGNIFSRVDLFFKKIPFFFLDRSLSRNLYDLANSQAEMASIVKYMHKEGIFTRESILQNIVNFIRSLTSIYTRAQTNLHTLRTKLKINATEVENLTSKIENMKNLEVTLLDNVKDTVQQYNNQTNIPLPTITSQIQRIANNAMNSAINTVKILEKKNLVTNEQLTDLVNEVAKFSLFNNLSVPVSENGTLTLRYLNSEGDIPLDTSLISREVIHKYFMDIFMGALFYNVTHGNLHPTLYSSTKKLINNTNNEKLNQEGSPSTNSETDITIFPVLISFNFSETSKLSGRSKEKVSITGVQDITNINNSKYIGNKDNTVEQFINNKDLSLSEAIGTNPEKGLDFFSDKYYTDIPIVNGTNQNSIKVLVSQSSYISLPQKPIRSPNPSERPKNNTISKDEANQDSKIAENLTKNSNSNTNVKCKNDQDRSTVLVATNTSTTKPIIKSTSAFDSKAVYEEKDNTKNLRGFEVSPHTLASIYLNTKEVQRTNFNSSGVTRSVEDNFERLEFKTSTTNEDPNMKHYLKTEASTNTNTPNTNLSTIHKPNHKNSTNMIKGKTTGSIVIDPFSIKETIQHTVSSDNSLAFVTIPVTSKSTNRSSLLNITSSLQPKQTGIKSTSCTFDSENIENYKENTNTDITSSAHNVANLKKYLISSVNNSEYNVTSDTGVKEAQISTKFTLLDHQEDDSPNITPSTFDTFKF
ncbi:uncharacterized protein CMU_040350 [Cryptosporidium muris RN66]|uniref:Uncharacterized protein n=1 Tax=Cryptosporidium muris (strain RN66) TaxID=441375 RepID=B6A9S5_CRYMR|nr:uncharacterized protein CMU_040350 [Cryptosporidium muris RN66]EEA04966.1 hypothetical protein CMU_040350 [Cryptosporidium muris RN66]|eukprot:XP_002139315.1 hypothetical protein [Cryptosporidium muris RN66]